MNDLAIIILNWNGHIDTIECIMSVRKNESKKYTIFILDNNSEFISSSFIENWLISNYRENYLILNLNDFNDFPQNSNYDLYFIKNMENSGFAKGNNLVWEKIKDKYDFVLLLNNDTTIEKNAISGMVDFMKDNFHVGAVSCNIRLYRDKNILWNAGGYFTWYGDRKYYSQSFIDQQIRRGIKAIPTPFITGCAMMVRKSVSNTVGLFTEKFFFGEEDFNYCKRLLLAGISVESVLDSTIYHKVGTSIKKSQKSSSGYILHFSNRIINQKEFFHPIRWKVWRELYILAIFLKLFFQTKNINLSFFVIKKIKYYSSNYNEINYNTFLEISNIIFE